jgi:ferrous iron transport protein B
MLMEQLQGVKTRTVAIVGMPNSGKSTLFNALTGLRQRVANYPGVTVEPVVGRLQRDGQRVELMDLPGIYGLTPRSEDERIALAVLRGELPGAPLPEGLLVIADATQLERGLCCCRGWRCCSAPRRLW